MKLDAKSTIETGKAILGIELGSTRIKAVLIDQENKPIAQGSHTWENQLVNGLWTYSIDAIWSGLQDCYADLRSNVKKLYDTEIETLAAIGVSAMMHGYMPFNEKEEILVPFRTWRNTNTGRAAAELSELFVYNIPLRWSISHLYQAILDNEAHVKDIKFLTTLAGYVHWQITGEKVLGIGDASGMLPIDPTTNNYSAEMVAKFDNLIASKEYSWKLEDILPKVLSAGENAGVLTPEGCKKLDASGHLKAGIPVCPPEGDAGTGMVATNMIQRDLNCEVVNLGFSGEGKMDQCIARAMARIKDADVYVLDPVPNCTEMMCDTLTYDFVKTLRELRPNVPIVMVEGPMYTYAKYDSFFKSYLPKKNAAYRKNYEKLVADGYKNIYYVTCEGLTGDDNEGTVDGIHFTDIGFRRYADKLIPVLKPLLEK